MQIIQTFKKNKKEEWARTVNTDEGTLRFLDSYADELLSLVEKEVSGEIREGYYAQQVHEAFTRLRGEITEAKS